MKKILVSILVAALLLTSLVPAFAADYDKATVKAVQQALNDAGFDCGTPDGSAGKKTHAAIKAYREANGLTDSEEIDDELLNAMGITVETATDTTETATDTTEAASTTENTETPYISVYSLINIFDENNNEVTDEFPEYKDSTITWDEDEGTFEFDINGVISFEPIIAVQNINDGTYKYANAFATYNMTVTVLIDDTEELAMFTDENNNVVQYILTERYEKGTEAGEENTTAKETVVEEATATEKEKMTFFQSLRQWYIDLFFETDLFYENTDESQGKPDTFDFMQGKNPEDQEEYEAQLKKLAEGEIQTFEMDFNQESNVWIEYPQSEAFRFYGLGYVKLEEGAIEYLSNAIYKRALWAAAVDKYFGNGDESITVDELVAFYEYADSYEFGDEPNEKGKFNINSFIQCMNSLISQFETDDPESASEEKEGVLMLLEWANSEVSSSPHFYSGSEKP